MKSSAVVAISYADVLGAPHVDVLLAGYAAECGLPLVGSPAPQGQLYEMLEQAGRLQVWGAYVGDRLVGFAALLCPALLPHYAEAKSASVESLYVEGEHRDTGLGLSLMAAMERYAKAQGCTSILYSAPVQSQLERLLTCLPKAYQRTNSVFCRRLA